MNFTHSILLFGLLAVAIPIIIHLLNRRRHRTVKWGAMEFLRKASRESKGKKKLKHLIILTSRALAIAGIIFAFSDPFSNSLGSSNSKPNTVIFILDRSPSMELITNEGSAGGGLSKRKIALATISKTMSDMPDTKLLLLDSATKKITEINSSESLQALSSTAPTDQIANIPKLINSAVSVASDPDQQLNYTEIWVASDLQESNWNIKAKEWETINSLLKQNSQIKLRVLALTETSHNNKTLAVIKSNREGDSLLIETQITRIDGSETENINITYSIDNQEFAEEVKLTSSVKTIRKRIPIPANKKQGFGYVKIEDDTNIRDNYGYFLYGEKKKIQTVIVSDGGESANILKKAAAPYGFSHLSSEILTSSEITTKHWETSALVIWQSTLPTGKKAIDAEKYIRNGGIILFFPPIETSAQSFLDMQWGNTQPAPNDSQFEIEKWNQSLGVFKDGSAGDPLPVDRVYTIKRRNIIGDAITLAQYSDGKPFAVRKILDKGRALFISTLPDLSWSYLETSAIHLTTIHRLLDISTEGNNGIGIVELGDNALKLKPKETRARLDTALESKINNQQYEAGVWRLGQRTLASNRAGAEDLVEITEIEAIEDVLPDVSFSLLENRGDSEARSVVSKLWRFFLYATLIFLIIEAFLTLPAKLKIKPHQAKSKI